MNFLPISVNVYDKNILIVGGGRIASQKISLLKQFTNNITVVALKADRDILESNIRLNEKAYESSDLDGAFLVYACTDNEALNKTICNDARSLGILVNVVDSPDLCDFVSPAIYKKDNRTIAIGSNAENVNQSIKIRNEIRNMYDYVFDEIDKKYISKGKGKGKVYLIGFGPGDPGLLTLKACHLLHKTDIIFYDDLLNQSFLEMFEAKKVYVGKRKGNHPQNQGEINRMLVEAASTYRLVVRLKGGDPMIFARGGEELSFLEDNYIPVEIVPGITTAFAASAIFGIPFTQREKSSSVAFCTGHPENNLKICNADTLVYYMCASNIDRIAENIIKSGRAPETNVALLYNVSLPDQRIEISTLKELAKSTKSYLSPLIAVISDTITGRQLHNNI